MNEQKEKHICEIVRLLEFSRTLHLPVGVAADIERFLNEKTVEIKDGEQRVITGTISRLPSGQR